MGAVKVHTGQTKRCVRLLTGRLESCQAGGRACIWPGHRVRSRGRGTDKLLESHRSTSLRIFCLCRSLQKESSLSKLRLPTCLQVNCFHLQLPKSVLTRDIPIWHILAHLIFQGLHYPNTDGPGLGLCWRDKTYNITGVVGTTETPVIVQWCYWVKVIRLHVQNSCKFATADVTFRVQRLPFELAKALVSTGSK